MTTQDKKNLVRRVRAEVMRTVMVFPDNKTRGLDQAFGFVMGVLYVNQDDTELCDLIQEMWAKAKKDINNNNFRKY